MANETCTCHLPSVLTSAFMEWILLFLLFLDAFFSYLVRKMASFSKLQNPCLMCSRLNILSNKRIGSHWDLICDAHKSEISSLAYCSIHHKLSNGHEMCENCLFSFSAAKTTNPEMHKLLLAKLEEDVDGPESEIPKKKFHSAADGGKLKSKYHTEDTAKVPLLTKEQRSGPSIRSKICSCCSGVFTKKSNAHKLLKSRPTTDIVHRDGMDDRWVKPIGLPCRNSGADGLSHVRYRELKITSDSESEIPISDDDDANAVVRGVVELKEVVPGEKLIDLAPVEPEPTSLSSEKQLAGQTHETSSVSSSAPIGYGLEELKWNQFKVKASPPRQAEPMVEVAAKEIQPKCISQVGDATSFFLTSNGEVAKPVAFSDRNLKMIRTMNDNYKLSVSRGATPSPTFSDLVKGRDSARYHEDLKQKLSQISTTWGFDIPLTDTTPSPRVSSQGDESKVQDSSSTTGSLPKQHSEPSLESLDGGGANGVEGVNEVNRLKQQLELDRKSMSALYKELEEERSASAIAANQAMAMINRLQEEKAAMQMEALQYLRMMEEQAEYDQEALQKTNELLSEREKEMQDLEAEIESYRIRFGDEILSESFLQRSDSVAKRNKAAGESTDTDSGSSNKSEKTSMTRGSRSFKYNIPKFEDEKEYITECVKVLEKKVHNIVSAASSVDQSLTYVEQNGVVAEGDDSSLAEDSKSLSHKVDGPNEIQVVALSNEVFRLNNRLEALEADRDFLLHTVNTIRNGDDGIQFLQEIDRHLRELREAIVTK